MQFKNFAKLNDINVTGVLSVENSQRKYEKNSLSSHLTAEVFLVLRKLPVYPAVEIYKNSGRTIVSTICPLLLLLRRPEGGLLPIIQVPTAKNYRVSKPYCTKPILYPENLSPELYRWLLTTTAIDLISNLSCTIFYLFSQSIFHENMVDLN